LSKLAILILAAGNSSRMGVSKQLLKWKEANLLQHAMNTVNKVNSQNLVVLGANYSKIKSQIEDKNIRVLCNQNWKNGLGNSISFGINYIKESLPNIDNVLIMLADQPLIDADFLDRMIETHKLYPKKIICTLYQNERLGVPAIFNKIYFEDLLQLNDDKGAKELLKKYSSEVISLNGVKIVQDIDTLDDYEDLYKQYH
jgi:molybdenum cofactor cytidylyltransferase